MESIDTQTGLTAAPELSESRVQDIFSRIANRYDLFNVLSSMGACRSWRNRMIGLVDAGSDSRVLDVAGGTGDVAFAIAREKNPAFVHLTDFVPEMLEVAMQRALEGAAGSTDIDFDLVDAQQMPFEDSSYDVVTMAYGLRNMPRRKDALAEVFRVLRTGGQFVCLDFSTPQNPAWNAIYSLYRDNMVPLWGKLVTGDASGFVYLSKSIEAFPDQKGVAQMMRDVGFDDVQWHDCTGGIACIHTARKPIEEQ